MSGGDEGRGVQAGGARTAFSGSGWRSVLIAILGAAASGALAWGVIGLLHTPSLMLTLALPVFCLVIPG